MPNWVWTKPKSKTLGCYLQPFIIPTPCSAEGANLFFVFETANVSLPRASDHSFKCRFASSLWISMGPTLPPTNLDVLLLMGRVPGSSGVAASRYEFIFRSSGGSSYFYILSAEGKIDFPLEERQFVIFYRWLEMDNLDLHAAKKETVSKATITTIFRRSQCPLPFVKSNNRKCFEGHNSLRPLELSDASHPSGSYFPFCKQVASQICACCMQVTTWRN